MPRVLDWPHQDPMGPGGLVVVGIKAVPTSRDRAVVVVVHLVVDRLVVAACWVVGWVPEVHSTVLHHHC